MKKVKKFINNLYQQNGSFSFAPKNKIANLYSTCFAVMSLELTDQLKIYSKHELHKITSYIKKHQNKKTGLFVDKTCINISKHNRGYLLLQQTDFAQLALTTLGTYPKYKYIFLKDYKNKNYLKKWLINLNWENPWFVSNKIMFILNSFIYEEIFWKINNKKFINFIISWLDKRQDPKTGFWNLGYKSTLHNQMAGAYHFLFYYTYLNKKPNYLKKIIDSVLAIQNQDGLFNYSGGGASCDDLDAIDLLCRTTFYTNYKITKIKYSLAKAYSALCKNQNQDGGFCWAKRNKIDLINLLYLIDLNLLYKTSLNDFITNIKSKLINQLKIISNDKLQWKYSDVASMEIELNESDIWSTWFRLLAISMIENTFPEICNDKSFEWNMRKKCGLGFYKK